MNPGAGPAAETVPWTRKSPWMGNGTWAQPVGPPGAPGIQRPTYGSDTQSLGCNAALATAGCVSRVHVLPHRSHLGALPRAGLGWPQQQQLFIAPQMWQVPSLSLHSVPPTPHHSDAPPEASGHHSLSEQRLPGSVAPAPSSPLSSRPHTNCLLEPSNWVPP